QLDEFQKEVRGQLDRILTDEQKQGTPARGGRGRGGTGGLPAPGQILSASARALSKLTRAQDQQLDELQEAVNRKLGTIMTSDQKNRLQTIQTEFARTGISGSPTASPRTASGGPAGAAFVPPKVSLFRAARYAPDHPGLAGKELKPGMTVDEIQL